MKNCNKKIILINLVILLSVVCQAQNSLLSLGIWDLTNINGSIKAGGMYGLLENGQNGQSSNTKMTNLYGGMTLSAKSYFINPDYITLNAEAGYSPETFQNQSVIYPNRYDVVNTKLLSLNSTFFAKSIVSMTGAFNISNSYDSREGLTDVNSNMKSYATSLCIRDKFIPLTFTYNNSDWSSVETQTNNTYKNKQSSFSGRAIKTFRKKDRNELTYTHNDYWAQNFSSVFLRNITDNLELYNAYNLDSSGKSVFSSRILGTQQRGTDSFTQLTCTEMMNYYFPYNLSMNGSYLFYYNNRPSSENLASYELLQNTASIGLHHRLYQSLNSSLNYQYLNSNGGGASDQYNVVGFNLNYVKKVPLKGSLSLSYGYNKNFMDQHSQDQQLQIFNEPYVLNDNTVVLLKRPFVIEATIQVKDVTGTVIYRLNTDYILITNNGYIEIRRVPGGLISNNLTVYLSYSANQPGNTHYEMNVQNASANLSLKDGLLNFYAMATKQNYSNVRNMTELDLDVLSSEVYGGRITFRQSNAGAEYTDYRSSVYPYKMTRYFLTISGALSRRMIYSLNANDRFYLPVAGGSVNTQYYDASGMLSYMLSQRTKIDFTVAYQKQDGYENNLELLSGKLKLVTYVRGLNFTFGADIYQRTYLTNVQTNYLGVYFLVTKKF